MTDLQLAVLLRSYAAQLHVLVGDIEADLPEEMRTTHEPFIPALSKSVSYSWNATIDLREFIAKLHRDAERLDQASGGPPIA